MVEKLTLGAFMEKAKQNRNFKHVTNALGVAKTFGAEAEQGENDC